MNIDLARTSAGADASLDPHRRLMTAVIVQALDDLGVSPRVKRTPSMSDRQYLQAVAARRALIRDAYRCLFIETAAIDGALYLIGIDGDQFRAALRGHARFIGVASGAKESEILIRKIRKNIRNIECGELRSSTRRLK